MAVGVVHAAKMKKTVVVDIERFVRHPKLGKYMKRYTRCYVHDEKGEAREGDKVEIMETRPLSRLKRWRLLRVVERSRKEPQAAAAAAAAPAQG